MAKCSRCGGCCVVADMNIGEFKKGSPEEKKTMDKLRWLNYHRCDGMVKTRPDGTGFAILRIPMTCVNLGHDGSHYFCKIYKTRPDLCKRFKCLRQTVKKGK